MKPRRRARFWEATFSGVVAISTRRNPELVEHPAHRKRDGERSNAATSCTRHEPVRQLAAPVTPREALEHHAASEPRFVGLGDGKHHPPALLSGLSGAARFLASAMLVEVALEPEQAAQLEVV